MNTYEKFYALTNKIPAGKVASYGEVARAAGLPRGARLVGWALRALPPDTHVPWQRVVNRLGILSIVNPLLTASQQKDLLIQEGCSVIEKEGVLRLENPDWYRFD